MSIAQLREMLHQVWKWMGITSTVYAQFTSEDFEEYMFPKWDELVRTTEKLVLQSASEAINEIWTAVALDHEEENLLDFISEYASDVFVDQLVTNISEHDQPNASWQAAELIRRRKSYIGTQVLRALLHDTDPYVRKRARVSYDSLISETQE